MDKTNYDVRIATYTTSRGYKIACISFMNGIEELFGSCKLTVMPKDGKKLYFEVDEKRGNLLNNSKIQIQNKDKVVFCEKFQGTYNLKFDEYTKLYFVDLDERTMNKFNSGTFKVSHPNYKRAKKERISEDMKEDRVSSRSEFKLAKKAYECGKAEALQQELCIDAVSRGVFEQVMRERDIAIEQLHELGYEFGQKIEPCDDAVSRDAVLQAVSEGCQELRGVYGRCEELIKELPSVRPQESKTGHCSEDLSKRVEILERQMKEDKEEQIKKLKAEMEYARFCCALNEENIKRWIKYESRII